MQRTNRHLGYRIDEMMGHSCALGWVFPFFYIVFIFIILLFFVLFHFSSSSSDDDDYYSYDHYDCET